MVEHLTNRLITEHTNEHVSFLSTFWFTILIMKDIKMLAHKYATILDKMLILIPINETK